MTRLKCMVKKCHILVIFNQIENILSSDSSGACDSTPSLESFYVFKELIALYPP